MHPVKEFVTNHLRVVVITACAIVVVAAGITVALATGGSSSPATAAPTTTTPSTTTTTPTRTPQHPPVPRVKGTITAMTPAQWTITNPKGKTFTVAIGSATKYGTPKTPATASTFSIGQTIVVTGTEQGTTIQATRIATPSSTTATPTTTPAA